MPLSKWVAKRGNSPLSRRYWILCWFCPHYSTLQWIDGVTMITIVVASFGALSPRRVIVPRQSKQVTSSSRQHQKLRFPSAMAVSPNGMSDTSNSGWCHRSVKNLLFVTSSTQSEKRQASDCLVCLCYVFSSVQADGTNQPPSQPVWSW